MRNMMMLVVAIYAAASGIARAQQQQSTTELAKEVATRLGRSGAGALAAAMPDDPSRFVAALHIPGQLLVISSSYQAPALLRELIAKNDHRQVYLDLNSAGDRKGRFFVEDLRVDGLQPDREPNQPFDITWRDGVTRTLYNGSWKEQKLSEAEYRARFKRDTADYTRMLEVLLAASAAKMTSGT